MQDKICVIKPDLIFDFGWIKKEIFLLSYTVLKGVSLWQLSKKLACPPSPRNINEKRIIDKTARGKYSTIIGYKHLSSKSFRFNRSLLLM